MDCARKEPLSPQDLDGIETIIGYRFRNRELLQQAFTRDTYSNEHGGEDNQVLEFIGDTALEMVVVRGMASFIKDHKACGKTPDFDEEALTRIKIELVNDEHLAEVARSLEIHKCQVVGGAYSNPDQWTTVKPCSGLIEAVLGAVALDSNWSYTALKKVCGKMFGPGWITRALRTYR